MSFTAKNKYLLKYSSKIQEKVEKLMMINT